MNAVANKIDAVIDAIPGRALPGNVKALCMGLIAVGVGSLTYGFTVGDPIWAWGSWLIATVYFLALCQGGFALAVILSGTQGRWGRPLKRVSESFAFFLPYVFASLALFLFLGGLGIYEWNPATILPEGPVALEPHNSGAWRAKPLWLTPGFFVARQLLGLAFLIVLDMIYIKSSLRPDLMMAKARLGDKAPAWWDKYTKGAGSLDDEIAKSVDTQATMVPIIGFAYAFIMSMFAFDLVMSLSPWWFSNMFGGWFFMGALWLGLATIGAFTMIGRDWLSMGAFVRPSVTLDLGKLMLAGCMFWGYTSFAQLLPIYYADMPEETDFFLVRMFLPAWTSLTKIVAITCFLAPFTILLSRGIKKLRWPFLSICLLVMVGHIFQHTMLVMPSIHMGDTFPLAEWVIVTVGTWLGFLGGFILVVGNKLAQLPSIPIADPYLEDHPWDVHVHSLDHAHH